MSAHNFLHEFGKALASNPLRPTAAATLTAADIAGGRHVEVNDGTGFTLTMPTPGAGFVNTVVVFSNTGAGALVITDADGFGTGGSTSITVAQGQKAIVHYSELGACWTVLHHTAAA